MKRLLMLIVAWLLLFAMTVGIRRLLAANEPSSNGHTPKKGTGTSPIQALFDSSARAALEATPTKTTGFERTSPFESVPNAESHDMSIGISKAISDAPAAIHRCKEMVLARSRRPVEFVDLSFRVESTEKPGVAQLKQVVVERASMPLEIAEERCIVSALAALEVTVAHPHKETVRFPMCFRNYNQKTMEER